MGYPKHTWNSFIKTPPFEITGGTNEDMENPYYVSNGFLFNTFSLDYNNSVRIEGLNKEFDLAPNHKFYIEIDIDQYLQPSYAQIKCTEVNTDENWKYYPFPALIRPEFTGDEEREDLKEFPWKQGRILKFPPERRQTKLYILIGYRGDDSNKNGNSDTSTQNEDPAPVQILRENIILLGSMVDFVPGLIAVPYFYGGLTHIESLIFDKSKQAVEENRGGTVV
jgi:hypothetical protein